MIMRSLGFEKKYGLTVFKLFLVPRLRGCKRSCKVKRSKAANVSVPAIACPACLVCQINDF